VLGHKLTRRYSNVVHDDGELNGFLDHKRIRFVILLWFRE
jgi:hypothetical protein